jgi:hypothetical protein
MPPNSRAPELAEKVLQEVAHTFSANHFWLTKVMPIIQDVLDREHNDAIEACEALALAEAEPSLGQLQALCPQSSITDLTALHKIGLGAVRATKKSIAANIRARKRRRPIPRAVSANPIVPIKPIVPIRDGTSG